MVPGAEVRVAAVDFGVEDALADVEVAVVVFKRECAVAEREAGAEAETEAGSRPVPHLYGLR